MLFFGLCGNSISLKDLVLIINALHLYWFVMAYLGLYILSPVLNAFADNAKKKQYIMFLCVLFSYQTYFNLFHFDGTFGLGYSVLLL